jgi:hypothetical protein
VIGTLVAAALAGLGALKSNDDKKRQHQEAINAGEQQLWDQRNAEIAAIRDRMNGIDPRMNAFSRQLGSYRDAVSQTSAPQDWTPLVAALGKGAGAIYDESQKPGVPAAPSGEDVPGKNFSPAANYTPAVNYSDWEPVQAPESNYLSRAAKRFEDEDERALPGWLR